MEHPALRVSADCSPTSSSWWQDENKPPRVADRDRIRVNGRKESERGTDHDTMTLITLHCWNLGHKSLSLLIRKRIFLVLVENMGGWWHYKIQHITSVACLINLDLKLSDWDAQSLLRHIISHCLLLIQECWHFK